MLPLKALGKNSSVSLSALSELLESLGIPRLTAVSL